MICLAFFSLVVEHYDPPNRLHYNIIILVDIPLSICFIWLMEVSVQWHIMTMDKSGLDSMYENTVVRQQNGL